MSEPTNKQTLLAICKRVFARLTKLGFIRLFVGVTVFGAIAFRLATIDFTTRSPATCELHSASMSKHTVDLHYGMKPVTEMVQARRSLFPHADEPYESGYCAPSYEIYARVYVCTYCTEARTSWLATNGILWAAKAEVPRDGAKVEFTPADLNRNLDDKRVKVEPKPKGK